MYSTGSQTKQMPAMARRHRQAAELLAVMAAFTVVAYAVVSTGDNGPHRTVLVSRSSGAFQSMWTSWLHKVENQVEAGVDLSHGLSKQKEEKLDDLLNNDVKHDIRKEKQMIKAFDGSDKTSSDKTERVRSAIRSAINKPPASSRTSPKAASRAVRAAVNAVTRKDPKVMKEDKAERAEPVAQVKQNRISPFSKNVQNAVFRDDEKVAREEAKVQREEKALMVDEGVHQTKQARARHAIHAAMGGVQEASKPLKQAAKKPTRPAAAQHAPRRSSSRGGDSIAAMKAMDDKMEAAATVPAEGARAELAKVMGHGKDAKVMQGAMALELQKTDKDPEAAKEAKQEEKSWGGLLKNWGIGR